MFFLYTLTVLFYMTCSVYSECFFSIYLYSILFYHDKANKLVLAKNVLSLCKIKRSNKKFTLVTVQCQTVKLVIQWKKH